MPRRILSVLLLIIAATPISGAAAAAGPAADPFPIVTCADLPHVSSEPTCVVVDPAP